MFENIMYVVLIKINETKSKFNLLPSLTTNSIHNNKVVDFFQCDIFTYQILKSLLLKSIVFNLSIMSFFLLFLIFFRLSA